MAAVPKVLVVQRNPGPDRPQRAGHSCGSLFSKEFLKRALGLAFSPASNGCSDPLFTFPRSCVKPRSASPSPPSAAACLCPGLRARFQLPRAAPAFGRGKTELGSVTASFPHRYFFPLTPCLTPRAVTVFCAALTVLSPFPGQPAHVFYTGTKKISLARSWVRQRWAGTEPGKGAS